MFNLYWSNKTKYGILDEDTYNIDGNKYIIDIIGSFKVVFSKYWKQTL